MCALLYPLISGYESAKINEVHHSLTEFTGKDRMSRYF